MPQKQPPDEAQPMEVEVTNQGQPPPPPPDLGVIMQQMIEMAQRAASIQAQMSAERDRIQLNTIIKQAYQEGLKEASRVAQYQTKSPEISEQLISQALEVIRQIATNAAESAVEIKQVAVKRRNKSRSSSRSPDVEVETSSKKKPPPPPPGAGAVMAIEKAVRELSLIHI